MKYKLYKNSNNENVKIEEAKDTKVSLYIAVTKDINFYGLLKTIGTSPRQIKKIVKGQAIRISADLIDKTINKINNFLIRHLAHDFSGYGQSANT